MLAWRIMVGGKSTRLADPQGFENAPVFDITIRNCEFGGVAEPAIVKHVQNLRLENVRVNGKRVESLA